MDSIASRLATARKKKGWTQGQLAKEASVSQGTVGNIESGARRGLGSLPRLAEALGISHNWLRDGGEEAAGTTFDADQPDATDGEAAGRTGVLAAVNILGICLQRMDEESRKVASHLLREMAESPAGGWSGRLADLIEKYSTPGLFEEIGIYVRAGNYALSSRNDKPRMSSKSGSAQTEAIKRSNQPTGDDDASLGEDRNKDQNRGGDGAARSG